MKSNKIIPEYAGSYTIRSKNLVSNVEEDVIETEEKKLAAEYV